MDLVLAYVDPSLLDVLSFDEAYELAMELDQQAADALVDSIPSNTQMRLL
jgi:hypothetical protein